MERVKGLKVGKTFEAGEMLAYDPNFFHETANGSIPYKLGALVPIAVFQMDQTYEDSILISDKLKREGEAEITVKRTLALSPKANLAKISKVGDKLSPNTALAVFENISDDEAAGELLNLVGKEFEESIHDLTTNVVKSKYDGVVSEVRVYYNYDLDQFSPTIRKFINNLDKIAAEKVKVLSNSNTRDPVRVNRPERVNTDKIHGESIDGILVEFYIKTIDSPGVGDKFSINACKGIVAKVFKPGKNPIMEDGTEVDYVVSPLSLVSRMTTDIFYTMWTNATLIELKKVVLEMAGIENKP